MARDTTPELRRAAIYCRISDDKDGEEKGVKRQEVDCRKLAKRLGYEVLEPLVFIENDTGASSRSRKARPLYAAMLEAAKRGEIQAIIAYSTSRITRRVREYLDLIDLVEKHGIQIHTLASGDVNLSTADGRGVAITLAAWDAAEAERIGERVSRAKAQAVEDGRYRGGRRPYGFQKDGVTIIKSEAEVIRWASDELLKGRTIRALVNELNDRNVPSADGRPWATSSFRELVLRPRNAGLISTGQRSHGNFKVHGKAVWKPIVTEEVWRAVFDKLTDPSRRTNHGKFAVQWRGSGLYRCGVTSAKTGKVCGAPLRVARRGGTGEKPEPKRWFYRCPEEAHLAISQSKLDDYVLGVVAEHVRDPETIQALSPKDIDLAPDRQALAVLEQRLARTKREWDADEIETPDYRRKTAKIEADKTIIQKRMAEATERSTALPIFGAVDPGRAFEDAPMDIQRAVIASVVRVTVVQSRPESRGKRLNTDLLRERVQIVPVGEVATVDVGVA